MLILVNSDLCGHQPQIFISAENKNFEHNFFFFFFCIFQLKTQPDIYIVFHSLIIKITQLILDLKVTLIYTEMCIRNSLSFVTLVSIVDERFGHVCSRFLVCSQRIIVNINRDTVRT